MFAAHSLSADTITHATVTYNGGPGESVLFTLSSSLSKGFGDIPGGIQVFAARVALAWPVK